MSKILENETKNRSMGIKAHLKESCRTVTSGQLKKTKKDLGGKI